MTSDQLTPTDVTEAQLADCLEGRPIRYHRDGVCNRCSRKNSLRVRYAGADADALVDETFNENERIRFTSIFDESWSEVPAEQWRLLGLFHEDHPQKSREDFAVGGTAQVVATATLVRAKNATVVDRYEDDDFETEDEFVLSDVAVEFYSPPDEGEDRGVDRNGETVVAGGIGDRPGWPEEENEWRKHLIREGEDPD